MKEIIINLAKKHKHFDSERGLIKLLNQESEIEEEITNQKPKLDFKKEMIQLKKKRVIKKCLRLKKQSYYEMLQQKDSPPKVSL